MTIQDIKEQVLDNRDILPSQAEWLMHHAGRIALYEASHEVMISKCSNQFELCSIINVKSGRCSEDCHWCAQSAHYPSPCETFPLLESQACVGQFRQHDRKEVRRVSLVSSGKRMSSAELEKLCTTYSEIKRENNIGLCASLGLLDEESLLALLHAGVTRYHCNLETAPSYFPSLCSTHTQEEKITTLQLAKQAGMEICCGGIIGMGETAIQRLELAFALKRLKVDSIPLNLLQAIPGTPLENISPLTDEEVLTTIALFRFIHPSAQIRLAGGRLLLGRECLTQALYTGINGAITGDLLTTTGASVNEDIDLIHRSGFTLK